MYIAMKRPRLAGRNLPRTFLQNAPPQFTAAIRHLRVRCCVGTTAAHVDRLLHPIWYPVIRPLSISHSFLYSTCFAFKISVKDAILLPLYIHTTLNCNRWSVLRVTQGFQFISIMWERFLREVLLPSTKSSFVWSRSEISWLPALLPVIHFSRYSPYSQSGSPIRRYSSGLSATAKLATFLPSSTCCIAVIRIWRACFSALLWSSMHNREKAAPVSAGHGRQNRVGTIAFSLFRIPVITVINTASRTMGVLSLD